MVHMMDDFLFIKNSSKKFFHNIPMLGIVPLTSGIGMIGKKNIAVTISHNDIFPIGNASAFITAIKARSFAVYRNKFFAAYCAHLFMSFLENFLFPFSSALKAACSCILGKESIECFPADRTRFAKLSPLIYEHEYIIGQTNMDVKQNGW